jgi:peroxiredoxin Q/BCP
MDVQPAVGAPAPDFLLRRDDGSDVALDDFAGRTLVLYFYPKADTPGCTIEAQAFSYLQADFEKAGLGVSADPVPALRRFKRKHGLSLALASDESHALLSAYGVWVEKSMFGRRYMGIERSTFLIDPQGRIARIWRKVRVEGHAAEVLAAVRALRRRG